MPELVELSSFDAMIKEHGLAKTWKYRQLDKLSEVYKRFRLPVRESAGYVVPEEEMRTLILLSSKKGGILPIIGAGWTVLSGRRMTFLTTQSHGRWQRHYATPRDKGKVAVAEPRDLIALKPRFAFYADFIKDFKEVFARGHYAKLVFHLKQTQNTARKYIHSRCKDPRIANSIAGKSYEDFYLYFLDKLVYGESPEVAFGYAVTRAPRLSEASDGQGSSKEVGFNNMELLEEMDLDGTRDAHTDSTLHLDFKKYARGFLMALLNEQLSCVSAGLSPREAKRAAGVDFAIFIMRLREMTDEEIHQKLDPHLHPRRSRQYVGEMRKAVMLKAQEAFAPLRQI